MDPEILGSKADTCLLAAEILGGGRIHSSIFGPIGGDTLSDMEHSLNMGGNPAEIKRASTFTSGSFTWRRGKQQQQQQQSTEGSAEPSLSSSKTHQLCISLKSASDLLEHGQGRQLLSSVQVHVLGGEGKRSLSPSESVSNTGNPVFNIADLLVDVNLSLDIYLQINVLDQHMSSDNRFVTFPLYLLDQGPFSGTFVLQGDSAKSQGTLEFSVDCSTIHSSNSFQREFDWVKSRLGHSLKVLVPSLDESALEVQTFPGKEEVLEARISVGLCLAGNNVLGVLFLSQYRMLLVSQGVLEELGACEELEEMISFPSDQYEARKYSFERLFGRLERLKMGPRDVNVSIPLGNILQISRIDNANVVRGASSSILRVQTHNFVKVDVVFSYADKQRARNTSKCIHNRVSFLRKKLLHTPASADFVQKLKAKKLYGWDFSLSDEYLRQKADEKWSASPLNASFELCSSYPRVLYFPRQASEQTIRDTAKYRSRSRLSALSYYHAESGAGITRSSQPLIGLSGKSSEHDEKLLDLVRLTTPEHELIIVDARSKIAAGGNRFRGKGTESIDNYRNSRLFFMDIENIHAMRESIDALFRICTDASFDDLQWLSALDQTKWMAHVRTVLLACSTTARYLQRGYSIVCHCSDGWDRTAQLCGIAQILLDPFARTCKGFQMIVEKDWLAFGHKFEDRLGNPACPDERSPVFLQFIDCVWQILVQFPHAFEFGEEYLLLLVDFLHSGWFGNFYCNSQSERIAEKLSERSLSLWACMDAFMLDTRSRNGMYSPQQERLSPVCSLKKIRVWSELYLRYDRVSLHRSRPKTVSDTGCDDSVCDSVGGSIGGWEEPTQSLQFWVPNKSAAACYHCHRPFSKVFRKKNHCRLCGHVFCESCITRVDLSAMENPEYKDKKQKVCFSCNSL